MNVDDQKKTLQDVSVADGSIDETLGESAYIDLKAQKKLLLKLDLYLAPIITLIFLCAYLDRSNIGNAQAAGMGDDLGLVGNQYGNAVTLFYVFYVAGEIPSTILMKKLRPNRMIPALVFCCTFYMPQEQALRISYLFVSAALSGAFGGLFAFALLKMDGVQGLEGWRWLFIVEGCLSILIAFIVYFLLPNDFETARFLTQEDKELMRTRMAMNARYNGAPEFDWKEVRKAFRDPKLYISCWCQFMADICSFGLSTFMPTIIRGFGYGTVETQLLTVPVYIWASIAYTIVSWMSDRFSKRAYFMVPGAFLTAVGYAVQLGVPQAQRGALYFSIFLIAPGIYIIVGLNAAWLLNSHAGYHKRATAVGTNQAFGNSAGVVVGQIFAKKVNGKYVTGLSVSLGAVLLALLGHIALWAYMRSQNKKREAMSEEEREREINAGKDGDYHPDYRYAL
ncbi:MFS general substrate transporter [Aureobasidium pullulans]|nr:MFS general substrate transporter [Aureobasidium pullulans]THY58182.1 MFS general substrate transporter [Aureobasidium pullulans]